MLANPATEYRHSSLLAPVRTKLLLPLFSSIHPTPKKEIHMKIRIGRLAMYMAWLSLLGVFAASARATTYQAENATISSGGIVDTQHAGYTGTGFVDYANATGSYVEFAVNTANTSNHTLTFRHANGTGTNRPMEIKVDGVVVSSALAFNGTGAWTTWADKTLTVSLTPGNHIVRATATTSNGGPNLDKLDLTGGTPVLPATTYQAENATISQGVIETNWTGYTGTGFVDSTNVAGSYVEFAINTADTGSHTLTFRFANGTTTNRPMEIKVDGAVVSSALAFNGTGAWSTWADQTVAVSLASGTHTVRATGTTSNGGPNLDKLDITPPSSGTAPVITTHPSPATQTVSAGVSVTYTVAASGSPAPTYQWFKDGANISGATAASLVLNSVTAASAGAYSAVATNSAGSATSNSATLMVNSGTPDFSQIGWSTQNGGTAGGSASTVVNVSTVAALQAAASSTTSQTIRITAPLTSNSGAVVTIKSNKTILGDGTNGVLQGIGFSIQGNTSNIIIRNLKMTLSNLATPTATNTGDLIQVYGDGGPVRNIWIDHCEFFAEAIPAAQQEVDKYDGMIDLTKDVAFVTISWCHFRDNRKCNLVGSSDTDDFDRRTSFHHNRYDNVLDRTPSYRFGKGHVYNSYFKGIGPAFSGTGQGVNSRMGATLLVEGNVFEDCNDPLKRSATSFLIVGAGSLANQFIGCSGDQESTTTSGASLTIPYTYTADATSTVKNTVLTWAGFGKITP